MSEENRVRPFSEFLSEHRDGDLMVEISSALNQLVQAVEGVGKPGSLTIVLNVKRAGRSHGQVLVSDDVKLKLPEPDREELLFFVDADSNLTRRNPWQEELPGLREVPARPAKPIDIDEETGEIYAS